MELDNRGPSQISKKLKKTIFKKYCFADCEANIKFEE